MEPQFKTRIKNKSQEKNHVHANQERNLTDKAYIKAKMQMLEDAFKILEKIEKSGFRSQSVWEVCLRLREDES